jgi:hypothetical protein
MPNDSIVLELQREALDEKIRTSVLLRKALVVAKKLRIRDFEEWANKELSGYQPTDTTPHYRLLRGEVKAWNPYRGWVPVYFSSAKQAEVFSSRGCGQAIPEIEGILPSLQKPDGHFVMPFPKDIELQLLKSIHPLTEPKLHINQAEIFGIIETVKTVIFNWALQLEEDGILGEGLTFSPKEQEKATSSPAYHVTNFYGPVGQSQIQQQSPNAAQIMAGDDIVVADAVYIGQVKSLVPKVKDAIEEFGLTKPHVDELKSEIDTVEAQVRSPRPKRSIIKSSFETIQRILEGAAGGAAGQLIYEIGKLLASG